MVRRRANKTNAVTAVTTTAAGAGGAVVNNGSLLENGELKTTVGYAHLEEQYFASPKRKDCKVENGGALVVLSGKEPKGEKELQMHGKTKLSAGTTNKARSDRGGSGGGRTIGVPLATHSQTRTIENFFKAKSTAKTTKQPENGETPIITIDTPITVEEPSYNQAEFTHCNDNAQPPTPDTPIELDEDTSTDTDYSAKLSDETVFGVDFLTHRSQLRDSHSSSGSACTNNSNSENIFLQEPVLTLNVDKTPNQASSIKINTSLDAGPIFSSPPKLTSMLNGRFSQIVTLNIRSSPEERQMFMMNKPQFAPIAYYNLEDESVEDAEVVVVRPQAEREIDNDNDNDNSSCDSGIAFTTTLNRDVLLLREHDDKMGGAADVAVVGEGAGSQSRRRKPATPHRILCPSPIKTLPRMISPMHTAIVGGGRISSPSGRKLMHKEQLSPRKSPRHTANGHSKTRRRLNQQREFGTALFGEEHLKAKLMLANGCAEFKIEKNAAAAEPLHDDEVEVIDCENLETVVQQQQQPQKQKQQQYKCTSTLVTNLKQPQKQQKPIVALQKSHAPKLQSHKTKPQNGQPLAATNNNRDLKEFFPVRRSVRKTKTAVEEEMMRTLEKAVLEERADGLKIAYFEGKGRGVVAARHFERGEFVVEYIGDLISMAEASEREKRYALDENAGCYMYYFKHKNQQYCIDATEDSGKLGRLVNHSRNGNLVTKVVVVKQRPHLILLAKDDIEPGEELTYDYGDRSKESLLHHPWLAF